MQKENPVIKNYILSSEVFVVQEKDDSKTCKKLIKNSNSYKCSINYSDN